MSHATFYVDADTPYHKLHPVTKIVISFLSLPITMLATNIPFLFFLLLIYISIWFIGRIPPSLLIKTVKIGLGFATLFLIVQPVISAFNQNWFLAPFWPVFLPDFLSFAGPCGTGGICVYRLAGAGAFFVEGLGLGIAIALRLLVVMVAIPSALVTTSDIDMLLGIQKLKIPYDYALIGTMALRYVPLFNESRHRIAEAQKLRGTDLDRANPIVKIRSLLSILVPMIVSSLKISNELETAIESRAYAPGRERTSIRELIFTRKDKIIIIGVSILAGIAIVLNASILLGPILNFWTALFGLQPINIDFTIIPPTLPNEVLMYFLEIIYNLLWPFHPFIEAMGYQINFTLPSGPPPVQ